MLFNSFAYFVFLPIVVLFYFSLQSKYRNLFLLGASFFFYMYWRWEYIFLILFENGINFYAGRKIGITQIEREKKKWLVFALATNLGLLFFFKYFNFALTSLTPLVHIFNSGFQPHIMSIILPVGISFHTFTTLSYTLDVYRKKHKVEDNFVKFSLYVTFFPLLLAGPIERATNLLDQFSTEKKFSSEELIEGCKLIIWGLFKKVVIADRLAIYVNQIYGNPYSYSGSTLLLATLFFAFQIYCDFSGYTDIATGSARILGFRLMQNFNLPYLADSISNFWKRWHISLSTWFGDYLYKPLGGNRVSKYRWMLNIFIVFAVSGLWHGANWTFIIWGALHGFYYLLEYIGSFILKNVGLERRFTHSKVMYKLRIAAVFFIVLIAWVFFRSVNVKDAFYITGHMFTGLNRMPYLGPSAFDTALNFMLILILYAIQILQYKEIFSIYYTRSQTPAYLRYVGYAMLLLLIGILGVNSQQFIYFQF
jgi:alginate O-acetyltransferase complex protein AlgI